MATFQAHEYKNLRKASVTLLKAIRESSWNKFQFVFCQTWMPTIALRHCNSPLRKTRAFFKFLLQLRKKIRSSCIHYTTIGKTRTGLGQRFALFLHQDYVSILKGPFKPKFFCVQNHADRQTATIFQIFIGLAFPKLYKGTLFSERLSLRPNTLISVHPFALHRLFHLGPIISEEEEARPIYL